MTGTIVLAVVLGAGAVPVPDSVQHFPNASYWPGSGLVQVGNMLAAIADQAGTAMRTSGPGPQQLLSRWRSGMLKPAERVSVLLAGGTFHNPVLLPIYADGLRAPDPRERQAAAVGLAWTIGDHPPDPTAIQDDSAAWARIAAFADALARTTRWRSLVQVWSRSLLAAKGRPSGRGMVLHRTVGECLSAIREIAEPEDLDDLVALWPLLDRDEQLSLLTTLEIVAVRRFSEPPRGPRAPNGPWLDEFSLARVNKWVAQGCRDADGLTLAMRSLTWMWQANKPPHGETPLLVGALATHYPPLWFVPAELLVAYGGPALAFNRQWPDDPDNAALARRARSWFPVSEEEATEKPARIPPRR